MDCPESRAYYADLGFFLVILVHADCMKHGLSCRKAVVLRN
jgi:hypothetical protein